MSSSEVIHIGPVNDRPRRVAIFGLPPEEVFSVENHGPFQHPERVAAFGLLPEKTEVPQLSTPLSDATRGFHLRLIKPEDSIIQDSADRQQAR
jgi:hypothetical protein